MGTSAENARKGLVRRLLPLAMVTCLAAGCVDHTLLLKVRPDGSGELVETTYFVGEMVAMLKAMAAEQVESPEAKAEEERTKAAQRAAQLGEGVTFVSWEDLSTDATMGTRTVYRFDDISKLRVEVMASDDQEEGMGMTSDSEPLTFRYDRQKKGGVLTVVMAEPPAAEVEAVETVEAMDEETAMAEEMAGAMGDGMMNMMKPMLKGFKTRVLVEALDGKVVSTDAPHLEGSQVTVMELDFDQIVADEDAWTRLSELGEESSMTRVGHHMQGQPGIRMPTENEVRIELTDL